jgi:hypothetical protein
LDKATLVSGIAKLATAGQRAGFTIEQMIGFLNAGLEVESLMDLIAWRLEQSKPLAPIASSSRWIV